MHTTLACALQKKSACQKSCEAKTWKRDGKALGVHTKEINLFYWWHASQGTIEGPETWVSGHQSTLQRWCEHRNGLAKKTDTERGNEVKLTVKQMKRSAVGIIKWKRKNNSQQETENHGGYKKLKRRREWGWDKTFEQKMSKQKRAYLYRTHSHDALVSCGWFPGCYYAVTKLFLLCCFIYMFECFGWLLACC